MVGCITVANTHRITNVIKVAEFADLYESFSTMDKSQECYWRVIALIEKQTPAKQAKWWAYYDARQAAPVLVCASCNKRVGLLAHQTRDGVETKVCLDCAERWYQDQLTKRLIEAEKAGA